jgi:hypothetical protein
MVAKLTMGILGTVGAASVLASQPCREVIEVSEDPQIPNQRAIEGEDGHAMPPDMSASRLNAQQFPSMEAMKAKLGKYEIALFGDGEDVEADVSDELLMSGQLRAQRTTEGKVRMKEARNKGRVGVVPHFLVEDAHGLLLRRPWHRVQVKDGLVHGIAPLVRPNVQGARPAATTDAK